MLQKKYHKKLSISWTRFSHKLGFSSIVFNSSRRWVVGNSIKYPRWSYGEKTRHSTKRWACNRCDHGRWHIVSKPWASRIMGLSKSRYGQSACCSMQHEFFLIRCSNCINLVISSWTDPSIYRLTNDRMRKPTRLAALQFLIRPSRIQTVAIHFRLFAWTQAAETTLDFTLLSLYFFPCLTPGSLLRCRR